MQLYTDTYLFEDGQTAAVTSSVTTTGSITIPGFESAEIEAGSKTAAIHLYNPEKNDCYFEISIILSNGAELYHSNLLAPGQDLYEIPLNQSLSAGTYSATLHYSTYTTDGTYTSLNGADVPVKLVVS